MPPERDPGARTSRSLRLGAAILGLLALAAIAAPLLATDRPWLARGPEGWTSPWLSGARIGGERGSARPVLRAPIPYDPARVDLEQVLRPPSRRHWLGTDGLGRDLAARTLHGARVSLGVGLLAAGFALLLGVPAGLLAGYRGGLADALVSRCIETVLCFPTLLLALALLATAADRLREVPDAPRIALVVGATGWIPVARYLRAEAMKLREAEFVAAARASGAGAVRTATLHVLPSAMAPVLVTAAFTVAASIVLEAALSFLGLGVRPPVPTWGGLLTEARTHVDRAWWLALFPGLALFVAVLACNLVGEGLRDRLDPRSRGM